MQTDIISIRVCFLITHKQELVAGGTTVWLKPLLAENQFGSMHSIGVRMDTALSRQVKNIRLVPKTDSTETDSIAFNRNSIIYILMLMNACITLTSREKQRQPHVYTVAEPSTSYCLCVVRK
jgi:hypothetical protein